MEWTQEMRYRPYQEWSEKYVRELKANVEQSKWRLNYHIQPETGLLNDPNGFSFFNGKWHLFYQSFPFGAVHGLKSWYHVSSTDLIHWESEGAVLEPDRAFDSHGAYSGSALPVGEALFLAYTGNVRDQSWERRSYQLGAWMNKKGEIKKVAEPLISEPPAGFTAHFRDPQLIRSNEEYLMVIGGQTLDEQGEVLVFASQDLVDWQYRGPMNIHQDLGFMVECPNLLSIEEHAVLLLCPQGLKELDYQNVYPNTYILAEEYSAETNSLKNPQKQQVLDEGFDLYATQAFTAPDGRCLSVGWIGLPEMSYPTFGEGWAHSLSLIKELTIKDGKLYQYPVEETQRLRGSQEMLVSEANEKFMKQTANSYELQLEIPSNCQGSVHLFSDSINEKSLVLSYDTKQGKVWLDRSRTDYPLNPEFGEIRETIVEQGKSLTIAIFIDKSTCEIFINAGEKTLTANYYPTEEQTYLLLENSQKCRASYYSLSK
ncbi:sucrose-6-phosphate hydrolase [Enterococcus hulanensis]|uniref:sucrose-6-phosphate hydrolase n=1 Tax=Enterococcus TaxID=1350 RepID=UPI000B5A2435|nr:MULTISPECIES: sucrose-6-phosphate hydrolase [Enterococcus]MBO0410423.1 sucrose-6-phosphate hydrolase [Enterococcus hulanensis]OTO14401.1 hypothetical protein A5875_003558 [Enterococcus sp. 3H8_DIV0648]